MNIVALVWKDLRLQRGFLLPLAALETASIALLQLQMQGKPPGLLFPLVNGVALIADFLICYRTIVSEEKNRALIFLQTLPISRREIVTAKFASNLALVTGNLVMLLCLYFGAKAAGLFAGEFLPGPVAMVGALLGHWLINAFLITVALVFDSERALWVPFPCLFLAISALLNARAILAWLGLASVAAAVRQHGEVLLLLFVCLHAMLFLSTLSLVDRKKLFG